MTGASLGYSGYYMNTTLRYIGVQGMWWTSTVSNNTHAGHLMVTTDGDIQPQRGGNKYYGRAVRCVSNLAYQSDYATQGKPVALISGVCPNQTRAIHSQVVTMRTIINSR
ncbi:hypothetical protein IKE88_00970 [Candidatus Saccharibacteria bacterium]|nr:hypothetical protein [Candidatus Saccharibacteria bacterium]